MGGMLVQVLCLLFGVGAVLMRMCDAGALLGFEVTSHHGLLLSGSRHESSGQVFFLVASSGIGLLFENCIVDASIFEFI